MLVEVASDARAPDLALVDPDVESLGPRDQPEDLHRALRQGADLRDLGRVEFGVVRGMPIGAHQQVAGVVGIEVHDHVGHLAARHDETLALRQAGSAAERAFVPWAVVRRPALAPEIGLAVRRPQSLPAIRHASVVEHRALGHDGALSTWRRSRTADTISATASSIDTPLRWLPSR